MSKKINRMVYHISSTYLNYYFFFKKSSAFQYGQVLFCKGHNKFIVDTKITINQTNHHTYIKKIKINE